MPLKHGKKRSHTDVLNKEHLNRCNDSENNLNQTKNKKLFSIEIEDLKTLISEMENNYKTQIKALKNYKENVNDLSHSTTIRCQKFNSNEYSFNFLIYEKKQQIQYSVQLFNFNNKIELGRLKLPIGIDLQRIVFETPLNDLADVSKFLSNCKRYIDFYHERKKQFKELKLYVQNSLNCFADVNYNYTILYLQFFKIYDSEKNLYCNVIVYLIYDLLDTKPKNIKIDLNEIGNYKKCTNKHLQSYFERFKTLSLKEALISINENNNSAIHWEIKFDNYLSHPTNSLNSSEPKRKSISQNTRSSNKKSHQTKSTKQKLLKKKKILQKNNSNKKSSKSMVQTKLNFTVNDKTVVELQNKTAEVELDKRTEHTEQNKNLINELNKNNEENSESNNNFKENQEIVNEKSNFITRMSKKTHQKLLTSTPLQTLSKSRLKQAMRDNLDISSITQTRSILPSIPPNNKIL